MTATSQVDPIQTAHDRGWVLTKLSKPSGPGTDPGKSPITAGWPTAPGLTPDAARLAVAQGYNIGLVTGERSGRLLVVDIDGERPDGLSETFGVNTGSGGLHLYYSVPEGVDIPKANKVGHVAPGVDIRYTGGQVVYPPSVHPDTGAEYEVIDSDAAVAEVPMWVVASLLTPKQDAAPAFVAPALPASGPVGGHPPQYIAAALAGAAKDVSAAPQGTGNSILNKKSYALAGLGIDEATIMAHLLPAACGGGRRSEHEARKTIMSGFSKGRENLRPVTQAPAAPATPAAPVSPVPGTIPAAGNDVDCASPRRLADKYLFDVHAAGTCKYYRGAWYLYRGGVFRSVESDAIMRGILSETMQDWTYFDNNGNPKQIRDALKNSLLNDTMGQMIRPSSTVVDPVCSPPVWLTSSPEYPANDYIVVKNGLLHLPSRTLQAHSPEYFCTSLLPVEYDPGAESPEAWIDFLSVIWPGDDGVACAHLLAEWMGYVISNSMAHHKMLWLIGPPRSGKGTIARILRNLIAPGDSCAPTLCSLSDPRGATCMIDKQSAIIGDARLDDRNNNKAAITERLLSVSGGDQQTIPRKYLADWNGELTVKITLLSNEPPNLTDASGALASRLLMLRMTESFVGREDLTLADRLENELPGILNWCIDGLTRLRLRGKFTEPESSKALSRSFRAMSSPLSSFVEDRCIVSPAEYVTKNDIYEDYQKWCEEEGISHPMGKPKFGYSLQSVVPKIGTRQATCAGRRQWQYTGIRLKSGQAKFRTF